MATPPNEPPTLSDADKRARSRRNVAIALGLVAFAVLVFLITLAQFEAPEPPAAPAGQVAPVEEPAG